MSRFHAKPLGWKPGRTIKFACGRCAGKAALPAMLGQNPTLDIERRLT